jgi:hypothetical protein
VTIENEGRARTAAARAARKAKARERAIERAILLLTREGYVVATKEAPR